ncbi:hypothetical protein [Bradyrhizobium sp. WSM2793]|uniref:hypothetical protein n=1 Tax=Bradyrhizobium sp. WSM2793 TaxID=1038866 RepID=UPI000371B12A|nr:hypothetical protein [Bradyrhizobium sp. WSM2793]
MITKKIFAAAIAVAFAATPALAQTSSDSTKEKNGHHYSGGPKTEVPHHMGKKESTGTTGAASTGGHHYTGGPRAEPHHMGEKKQ